MSRHQSLPYLPAMFATCMLFQVLYVACIIAWSLFPAALPHAAVIALFPGFRLLDVPSFIYGLVASMFYGWFIAATFVFFYNLWPGIAAVTSRRDAVTQ